MRYADVIIDISHEKLDKTFQYEIPANLRQDLSVGMQVLLPFGKGDRIIKGYIVGFSDEAKVDPKKIKCLHSVVKDSIAIESQMILLAAWMKKQYGSTMNRALKTVIPIKEKSTLEKKVVHSHLNAQEIKDEYATLVARKRYSKAKERLLQLLAKQSEITWEQLVKTEQIPSAVIRECEKCGWLTVEKERTYRNPIQIKSQPSLSIKANPKQEAILEIFKNDYTSGIRKPYLLYGVTGSGKTFVYTKMIEEVLRAGKEVIVLIPEIALTQQTIQRFCEQFEGNVSVMNSRLSKGERFDQFELAKNGKIKIMVGPRSALFTPFCNLGLIIIDEEHETSYKSETMPKYHARDVALERARICNASVVMGSATPSLESYTRAREGEFTLLTLDERVEKKELPSCEIIDMREELRRGNTSILSVRLQEAIRTCLEKKEQIMLFINRRGMLGFVSCRACGHVIKCPHCDVSLHLHKGNLLKCHYCGYETIMPQTCPQCHSKYIGGFKAGTQKIEEIVKKTFPKANVLRMDTDTTKGKHGHDAILTSFANGQADILIGTQMIVKGHDFSNVTLMGILAADMSLNVSDYRGSERTFQLLTQAAGRTGRGDKKGNVIIQTYQPNHHAIVCAAKQDYELFYETEMTYRALAEYPPASHILMIQIMSKEEELAAEMAEGIAKRIAQKCAHLRMLGPKDAVVAKVNDIYKKSITVKDKEYDRLLFVKDITEEFLLEENNPKVMVWFDFDPLHMF